MSSIPVTQALSVITSAELFFFTLVSTNINCSLTDSKEHIQRELSDVYYLSLSVPWKTFNFHSRQENEST